MRLYDPDHEVLAALQGSNIELILDVPNSYLARIYYFQSQADTWVSNYVRNYTKGVKFRYISVGNEVQPLEQNAIFLLSAMQKIERAVSNLGIKVSTTIDLERIVHTGVLELYRASDSFLGKQEISSAREYRHLLQLR
uniref:glucan endo-1,3-beta-D-glucosidase n=1 Tax=Brassica campestris TaxID=3711 RepID=A0A3P6C5U4_BRACM|nr:unnamed protein product [Brassica rapa]